MFEPGTTVRSKALDFLPMYFTFAENGVYFDHLNGHWNIRPDYVWPEENFDVVDITEALQEVEKLMQKSPEERVEIALRGLGF